jgi:predicted RNA methylase
MNASTSAAQAAARRRAALANLQDAKHSAQERAEDLYNLKTNQKKEHALNAQEREVTAGHPLDLFPTPAALAARMVALADIRTGQAVLEPSAGTGRIAQAIKAAGVEPVCIELNYSAAQLLQARGYACEHTDFMTLEPGHLYDRVVMNPPFSNGQDITHVCHAFYMLKPGGRLVAIMSEGTFYRSDKKAVNFRAWLDEHNGTSEQLLEGTFKASGTQVNARLVVIDK